MALAGQAARAYCRLHLAEKVQAPFNVVITNVPGPQTDLYVAGHKLLSTMGMAPIADGMGLIITVLSYHGVLSISPTSCPALMPDMDLFSRYLRESANELEELALALKTTNGEAATTIPDAQALLNRVQTTLKNADVSDELRETTFQLQLAMHDDEDSWVLKPEKRTVKRGNAKQPHATLTLTDKHLAQILDGALDPKMAFMQGKLKVDGDVNKAIALGAVMRPSA